MADNYFMVYRAKPPFEVFKGVRFGRVDYAGAAQNSRDCERLVTALNGGKPRGFKANVTSAALKILQKNLESVLFEPAKIFPPDGTAKIPDVFTVTYDSLIDELQEVYT